MRQLFRRTNWLLVSGIAAACLAVSVLSHWHMIGEWLNGRYMLGIGDGLSQMLPFKKLLYDGYSHGSFFYAEQFGLGGGTYSQLGYYFATSLVFWLTSAITYAMEWAGLIGHPDLYYWANAILVVSIIRLAIIIGAGYLYFRMMGLRVATAFLGASIYGTNIIYFRHVLYWEFFADAMLWLPLLLIGVERIIRQKRPGLFLVMAAVSMFDNFYFAYINFILAGIYILVRWLIPLAEQETKKLVQIKWYAISGLLAFGISAVSFIPSVYGYLNNHRPPYTDPIPIFEMPDNILLAGRVTTIAAAAVICLWFISFYKERLFRFFAVLTILCTVLHFSPLAASMFNGFSAPQYRWEYFLGICVGGLAAVSLEKLKELTWRAFFLALAGTLLVYGAFYKYDKKLLITDWLKEYMIIAAILTGLAFLLYMVIRSQWMRMVLLILLILTSVYTANEFQSVVLAGEDGKKLPSREFMASDQYRGKDQVKLIRKIQKQETDPHARIDWMIRARNNTQIVQDFKGFSVYSSILNRELLFFYLYDLEIDMARESVSRYATLGSRANLYAMLEGKYFMIQKGDEETVPYGFSKVAEAGKYTAYQNENLLPFVRTANTVYTEKEMEQYAMLDREHAMLKGVILDKANKGSTGKPLAASTPLAYKTIPAGATYQNGLLTVTSKKGGLDLLPQLDEDAKDCYVSFYLKRTKDPNRMPYGLDVNGYNTSRKANASIYRTNVDDLTIRVPAADKISIRVPKGTYKIEQIRIYGENYDQLKQAVKEAKAKPQARVSWNGGGQIRITYNNKQNDPYMTLPVPFEKGWQAKVNGKKQDVQKANYAFIAVPLENGENEVLLNYKPPYFTASLSLTVISAGIAIWLIRRRPAGQRRTS